MDGKTLLLGGLGAVLLLYLVTIVRGGLERPTVLQTAIGFVTAFFDTLGIGSFATTTSVYKLRNLVPVKLIPGTLNVGHTLPTIAQAFIYTQLVPVESTTLVLMIAAAMAGSWLGAGVVIRWPRRKIQIGMGLARLLVSGLFDTLLGFLQHRLECGERKEMHMHFLCFLLMAEAHARADAGDGSPCQARENILPQQRRHQRAFAGAGMTD